MVLLTKVDAHGKIYLPAKARQRYENGLFMVMQLPDKMMLIPFPKTKKEALESMAEMGKKIKTKSLEKLKADIKKEALKEAGK